VASGIRGTGAPNPAQLIKLGPGTMTLSGVNDYEGNTYISNGVVKLGAPEAIPDGGLTTGWLVLDGGPTSAGTLDLNGFNETVNNISGVTGTVPGQIINTAGTPTSTNTLAFGDDANANTYAGLINDSTAGRIQLVKRGAAGFTLNANNGNWSGGVNVQAGTLTIRGPSTGAGSGPIILNDGTTLALAALGTANTGNPIFTPAAATANFTCDNLSSGHSGAFTSGDATSTNMFAGSLSLGAAATKQFEGFTGYVVIADGFNLRYSSTSLNVNGGDNTTFVVGSASTINTRNGVGNGEGIAVGALFGPGTLSGASGGNTGTTRFNIGGKGTDCTFDGTITGSGTTTVSIAKVGSATLTLNGSLSYDGSTTVSNGVLALAGSAVLDTSSNVVVRANSAIYLDPSGSAAGTLTLGNSIAQNLTGSGTVRGSLNALANSTIAPGDAIGTLTVTNTVTLAGTVNMELNRTNVTTTNDMIATLSVAAGGTLNVTNLGPDLITGDSFKLFSVPVSGSFATVNLPVQNQAATITYVWTNKLAIDGTIKVLVGASAVNTARTNITLSRTGNNIDLSWPSDHVGWTLQTNSVSVTSTGSWFAYPGSSTSNHVTITLDPNKPAIFYRMTYP